MFKTIDKFMVCLSSGSLLTGLTIAFGDSDYSLVFLCIVICFDFITGLMCGAVTSKLSSKLCVRGIMKKLMILIYVIIAHHVDVLMNTSYIRIAVCYMYSAGEVLSIIENGVKLGVPVPKPIIKVLENLNTEEVNNESKNN